MRHLTRCPVCGEHLRYGGGMRLRSRSENLLNCTRNAHEGCASLQECLDSHLVRGIQGNAMRAALFRRFKTQAQAWETLEIGLLEF